MSAIVDATTEGAEARRSRRRPQGSGGRRRGPRRSGAAKTEASGEAAAPRERKERPESVPVPASFTGLTKVGVVSAIIRKGRVKFGFINICPGPEIDESAPRIYFSFAQLADSTTTIRRGYVVSFKCSLDETGRAFADGIDLTEEGKRIAAAKEVEIAARRAERPAEDGDKPAAAKRERAPRERRQQEDKFVDLKVTCEGKAETKTITFNFAQSVGKLKNVATTAFEAPVEYNVFHEGVFLTKALLVTLQEGDKIHLAAPKDEPKA